MQYVNTVELRDQANAILHRVQKGELVIVTFRGKPCARIQAITDDDLEALVEERLLKKAEYRQKIAEALLRGIFLYANNLGGVKVAEQSRTQGKAAPLDVRGLNEPANTRSRSSRHSCHRVDFPRFRGHLSAWVERPGQGGSSAELEAAVPAGVPS